jgi:hypothetical protein
MINKAAQFIHSFPFSYYVAALSSKYSLQPSVLEHTQSTHGLLLT